MSRSAMLALVGLSLVQRGGALPAATAAVPHALDGIADVSARADADPAGARLDLDAFEGARVFALARGARAEARFARTAALGDLDEDGLPDVIEPLGADAGLRILLSDGAGGWSVPVDHARLTGMLHVRIGDVDGDGHQDVVGTSRTGGELLVHLGDGSGGFARTCSTGLTSGLVAHAFELADLDGDGRSDLVMREASPIVGALRVHLSAGAGYLCPAIRHPSMAFVHAFQAADVDLDGRADLVVVQWDWPRRLSRVLVLPGLGDGRFGPEVELDRFEDRIPTARVADLNGDGLPDVAVAASRLGSPMQGEVDVHLAARPGEFGRCVRSPLAGKPEQLALADLDGDGTLDLFAGSSGPRGELLLGLGEGAFEPWCQVGPPGAVRAVADMDRDGQLDLVCDGAVLLRRAP